MVVISSPSKYVVASAPEPTNIALLLLSSAPSNLHFALAAAHLIVKDFRTHIDDGPKSGPGGVQGDPVKAAPAINTMVSPTTEAL